LTCIDHRMQLLQPLERCIHRRTLALITCTHSSMYMSAASTREGKRAPQQSAVRTTIVTHHPLVPLWHSSIPGPATPQLKQCEGWQHMRS
jgi:hypothetical protein